MKKSSPDRVSAGQGLTAAHRRTIETRWRRLTPDRQALLVLAHLRCGDAYARFAAGFGIGVATVYRYVTEAVDVLSALAPSLCQATAVASRKAYVILDGTCCPPTASPPIARFTRESTRSTA
jgi:hypothetical protein